MPDGTTGSPDIGPKPQNTDVIVSGKRISLQKSADGKVVAQDIGATETVVHEVIEGLAGGPVNTPEVNTDREDSGEIREEQLKRIRSEMRPMAGGAIDPIMDLSTKTFTNKALGDMATRLVDLRGLGAIEEGLAEKFKDDINAILKKEKDPKVLAEAVEIKQALIDALKPPSPMARGELERKIFQAGLKSLLTEPAVAAELTKPNPNFSLPEMKDLSDFVNSLNPSEEDILLFADYISNPDLKIISDPAKRILFEWAVENVVSLPEKGSHEARYRLDLYTDTNLTKLKSMSFRNFDPEFASYVGELAEIREASHELRRNLTQGDNYKKFIQEGLRTHGLDFMRNKLAGVAEVVSLYETFSSLKTSERREWFNTGDTRDIRDQVSKVLRALGEKGQLLLHDRPLTGWEIERALGIGETFFAGTQRRAMYSAVGAIPPGTSERIGSLPDEFIVRPLASFKVTAARFFNSGGSRELLRKITNRLRKDRNHPSNETTLFGIDEDSWILNGAGALDSESHGWRSHLMFFGDMRVNIDGNSSTLLEYFAKKAIQHGGKFEPDLGWAHGPHETKDFARDVEDSILGQRLYLSPLLKHGFWAMMDEESRNTMKTQLWQKVAIFDPMGVASLNPEILNSLSPQEMDLWQKLTKGDAGGPSKLGIAAAIRLRKESVNYFDDHGKRVDRTDAQLRSEKEAFLRALDGKDLGYLYQIMGPDGYFSAKYGNSLSVDEQNVIKKVIVGGIKGATRLNKAKLPFAFLINDAPHVAWDKTGDGDAGLGDENLFRILLNDQGNFTAGWNEMNSLVENPTAGAIDHFVKAVEAIGAVIGREDAQKRIEPFIVGYVDMARERPGTTYLGPIRNAFLNVPGLRNLRFVRNANSEMEKYFKSSGISFDEGDRATFYETLAAKDAISNDISEGMTMSQLNRLKRESWADGKANTLKLIKILSLILPSAIIYQLFKSMFSKETLEGLEG